MLGNLNGGYTLSNNYIKPSLDMGVNDFNIWSAAQQYRTHYRDMSKQSPIKTKKYAIPGYSGYIPGTSADTNFGSSYATTTKHQLNRQKYLTARQTQVFPNRPLTQQVKRALGRIGGGLEDEYHTVSRFHGKKTIPLQHPNFGQTSKQTCYKTAYIPQEPQRGRIFRTTDPKEWKKCLPSERPRTQSSGFVQNSTLFDGCGWLPSSNLHGNNVRTEYRNRFNPQVPFHPDPLKPFTRTKKQKEWVY